MKIAYFASSKIPSLAANSVQVMKMCQAFAANGHQVELFARRGQPELTEAEIFAHYGITRPFKMHLVSAPECWGLGGLIYGIKVAEALQKSNFKPDVLYGRNLYAMLACSGMAADMLFEAHAAPAHPGRKLLENILFGRPRFKKLITINSALHNYYLKSFRSLQLASGIKSIVAHDGADLACIPADSFCQTQPVKIGYAGGLFPGKGIEVIIAAAVALPQFAFHIAGGSEQEVAKWRSRCSATNVYFRGHLKHAEIEDFLASCQILLAPYQMRVTTNPQGIGNIADWMSPLKIFEYMASRRPIIASRMPAIEEILIHGHNALLARPANHDEWCRAILELNSNKQLSQHLADTAFADLSNNYTWETRARKVLYQSKKFPD